MARTITIELPEDPRAEELARENAALKKHANALVVSDRHHQELYLRWWQRGQTYQQQIRRALRAMESRNYGHAEKVLRGLQLDFADEVAA